MGGLVPLFFISFNVVSPKGLQLFPLAQGTVLLLFHLSVALNTVPEPDKPAGSVVRTFCPGSYRSRFPSRQQKCGSEAVSVPLRLSVMDFMLSFNTLMIPVSQDRPHLYCVDWTKCFVPHVKPFWTDPLEDHSTILYILGSCVALKLVA